MWAWGRERAVLFFHILHSMWEPPSILMWCDVKVFCGFMSQLILPHARLKVRHHWTVLSTETSFTFIKLVFEVVKLCILLKEGGNYNPLPSAIPMYHNQSKCCWISLYFTHFCNIARKWRFQLRCLLMRTVILTWMLLILYHTQASKSAKPVSKIVQKWQFSDSVWCWKYRVTPQIFVLCPSPTNER